MLLFAMYFSVKIKLTWWASLYTAYGTRQLVLKISYKMCKQLSPTASMGLFQQCQKVSRSSMVEGKQSSSELLFNSLWDSNQGFNTVIKVICILHISCIYSSWPITEHILLHIAWLIHRLTFCKSTVSFLALYSDLSFNIPAVLQIALPKIFRSAVGMHCGCKYV